ncbi:hypothetical protein QOT17_000872 [Balamuthia mandrillaris]
MTLTEGIQSNNRSTSRQGNKLSTEGPSISFLINAQRLFCALQTNGCSSRSSTYSLQRLYGLIMNQAQLLSTIVPALSSTSSSSSSLRLATPYSSFPSHACCTLSPTKNWTSSSAVFASRKISSSSSSSSLSCSAASPAREFWQTQENLKGKHQEALNSTEEKLHFVFVEGPAGTGKKDFLWRLRKIGYRVLHGHSFVPLAAQLDYHKANTRLHAQVEWTQRLLSGLRSLKNEALEIQTKQQQPTFKDNIVFVHRSPLSSYLRLRHEEEAKQGIAPSSSRFFLELMRECQKEYSTSLIVCKSDIIRMKERLAERYFDAEQESEQRIRELLGEQNEDEMNKWVQLYNKLAEDQSEGPVDGIVDTTSTKQAVAQILKLYGIEMKWVFTQEQVFR